MAVVGVLALVLVACGAGTGDEEVSGSAETSAEPADATERHIDPGIHRFSLPVGGADRDYALLVPSSYVAGEPLPLVVAFHTWGRNSNEFVDGDWGDLAEHHGFLLAAPEGIDGDWAVAQTAAEAEAALVNSRGTLVGHPDGARDVELAEALLDDVAVRANVDGDRIYVTGESLGGWMASRVACEIGDRLAALGPSTNSLLYSDPCSSTSPLTVVVVGDERDPNHSILDARAASDAWAQHNGCSPTPSEAEVIGENDGDVVRELTYSGCDQDTSVTMLTRVSGFDFDEIASLWEAFAAASQA